MENRETWNRFYGYLPDGYDDGACCKGPDPDDDGAEFERMKKLAIETDDSELKAYCGLQ